MPTIAPITIRTAKPEDAAATAAIYNLEVAESTVTFDLVPRSLAEQRRFLAERSGGLAVIVAEVADEIVGFASLSFYRDRPAYRTSVENSIYVRRDRHGRGIGDALMTDLLRSARAHGFHAVFARIADARPASLQLHTKHGFELIGIEKEVGRKFGRWLDVALMQCLL